MGSKNLKAIAVRGDGKVEVADGEQVANLRKLVRELKSGPRDWVSLLPQEQMKKQICFGCINGCLRQTFSTSKGDSGKYMCQSALFYEIRAQRYYGEVTEVSYEANKMCDDYGMDTRAVETLIMWLSRCFRAGILTEEATGLPFSMKGFGIRFRIGESDFSTVPVAAKLLNADGPATASAVISRMNLLRVRMP